MKNILGIDIGSVSIALALISPQGKVIKTAYTFHQGDIEQSLKVAIADIKYGEIGGIAVTSPSDKIRYDAKYDAQISLITAVEHFHRKPRGILFVGGENFGLIHFDENGSYAGFKSSSSCAAGTGSFLDQQAKRLGFDSVAALSDAAASNRGDIPQIATRCAVFAKTDLIHAQQEGYAIPEISDGLCKGLAKNIVDTVFTDNKTPDPLIFAGGVALNSAVVKHLGEYIGVTPITSEQSHLYGAIGAALLFRNENKLLDREILSVQDIIIKDPCDRKYSNPPLKLTLSEYPDFMSLDSYPFTSSLREGIVEVDIYRDIQASKVYLGIDIGSTSTKCVIIDTYSNVLAGLYTKTSGNPIVAIQLLLEAIHEISIKYRVDFTFLGASTTGSGRKFIGKIFGADLIVDEITAHARAAHWIDPEVDTIIEIGGQDSKFTTLKDGIVTSSVMNNVCAAGTGSFIEEQAEKLGCPLTEYADRVMGIEAPAAGARCTVFMERDLNHRLTEGFSVNEILASVLHSVCENYLTKVAVNANIGDRILFQGATAKNKALIAAFEQRLNKTIVVSNYCHLTGAIGAALILMETPLSSSKFRGIFLFKDAIPVNTEVCNLCNNNCKIKTVTIQQETVGFGFLCGRDYGTRKFIQKKTASFDLIASRRKAFAKSIQVQDNKNTKSISIPTGLYLAEDRLLWEYFFNTLGIKTVSSNKLKDPIKKGKSISGAEFCAPMSAFYGHVSHLAEKENPIFLPVYFEDRDASESNRMRQYCYYTQYASPLASKAKGIDPSTSFITPVVYPSALQTKIQLYNSLKPFFNKSYWSISSAYDLALENVKEGEKNLKGIFTLESSRAEDIQVVLLGRPYIALENNMNKGIPDIFRSMGINCYYQDMIHYDDSELEGLEDILSAIHWKYSAKILEVAQVIASKKGVYPVFLSAFKCGPDSFILAYFKKIMELAGKPYLVLELDEHDSSVGYETRIEAASNSFRNHLKKKHVSEDTVSRSIELKTVSEIGNKTMLLPCLDSYSSKLCEAVLIRNGIDARLVPVYEESILKSLSTNTGQCLPINIVLHCCVDYIRKENIDPTECVIWMMDSNIACNIKMYPYFLKSSLESFGGGLERVEVYAGGLSFSDISLRASSEAYFAFMFGGMLRRMACKIRPYETVKGLTDSTVSESMKILYNAFLGQKTLAQSLRRVITMFQKIETVPEKRPKIAIFGDIYVRDNDAVNGDIIKTIEEAGGEAITMALSDFAKMIADPYTKRWLRMGFYKNAIQTKMMLSYVSMYEQKYMTMFNEILQEKSQEYSIDTKELFAKYNIKLEHSGESADNIIKTFLLKKNYPDIALFVCLKPIFCCAGLVTEAMSSSIEQITGVPVVTITYDGTSKPVNKKIIPYIMYLKRDENHKKPSQHYAEVEGTIGCYH